jgi:hypothetical protein
LRQAMTWARTTDRNSSGFWMPVNCMKSWMSIRYAFRVRGLMMLANHSTSGGTSAKSANSTALRTRFEANGLFESLVKNLASQPWKLDHINRIITDLRKSADGKQVIPAGFDAIWDPIWASRKALRNE